MMKPLDGIHIIEFAGLGPAPFAAMMFADMGAKVTRITRTGPSRPAPTAGAFLDRGREDVSLDLKSAEGVAAAKRMIKRADAIIEGFRPGKMEGLGLGPDDLFKDSPMLVYGRMTGWGQSGPMAHLAGHDINYLAISGMLSLLGEEGRPPLAPLNLVADFGGGGMYLAFGLMAAIMQAKVSGIGQVVDAAMIHGVTHLSSMIHGRIAAGSWNRTRHSNMLDGGAPFYRCYETSNGRFIAVGALETAFFRTLIQTLGLNDDYLTQQQDQAIWPRMQTEIEQAFAEKTQAYWTAKFDGIDACVTPVLTVEEAKLHPQMINCFIQKDGFQQPSCAPRIVSATNYK